ncbi:MAG: hypothetical protein KBB95_30010 [Deltaproteobacteria bacterium]|nr:hypothetical protein [Deltaproteobacteria bacterium]
MSELTRQVLEPLHVWVNRDTPFQRRARLAQARWRERQGYAEGVRNVAERDVLLRALHHGG